MAGQQTKLVQAARLTNVQRSAQVSVVDRVEGASEQTQQAAHSRPPSTDATDALLTDMTIAKHDPFQRGQTLKADRSARMQLVRADADFGAKPVFEAIGKAG